MIRITIVDDDPACKWKGRSPLKHKDILDQLTLEQKIALLSGRDMWSTQPFPGAGVPGMTLSDGPHGVRRQLGEGDHLGLGKSQPATCFPTASGLANSWNPELARRVGRAIGQEAVCQGVNVLLGPGLNLKRSPLGGRNFEYYSEDPYLSGKLAAGFIRGVQENGIAACPKHLAVNSQEHLRMTSDSVVDRRTLRELYLTGFEIAVEEGHPRAIMSSYNRINGVYANENSQLLTDLLRREWGFDGIVVTDWGASNDHGEGVRAGSNLEMPGTGGDSDREVLEALQAGRITREDIDRRVDELLEVILATHPATEGGPKPFDEQAHHRLAREAALETAVLLKNDDNILPLAPGTRVAVLGRLALNPRYQGAGSSQVNPTRLDTPLEALKDSGLSLVGYAQGYGDGEQRQAALEAEALELAGRADVVLLWLGLPESFESEGMDRNHLSLPEPQITLARAVAEVNPNLVVVLSGGAPVELPFVEQCRGLLHGYLGGQAGAGALADLLTGKANPSGKLAESYPLRLKDVPNRRYFPGPEATAEYREGLFVGYRYYETARVPVRFPFGFGLSYTTFRYADLTVTPTQAACTVENAGDREGSEIVELYISWPDSRIFRPRRELKGFAKVALEPGQRRRVTIPLDDKAFRYFNVKTGRWEVEGGRCLIEIGASVQDIRLTASLEVAGTGAPLPYGDRASLAPYFSGRVEQVSDEAFAALLGHPIPPARWDRSRGLDYNDSLMQMQYARAPLARLGYRVLRRMQDKSQAKGMANLNVMFVFNMPFRGMAKLTGGMVTRAMARAILEMVNGHFFRGLFRLLAARRTGRRERKRREETLR